jgi:O-antigen/teichoic acid export membrane protein
MSLQAKAISGFFWTFSQQFSIQLINFIVSIILARILLPEEFGLIGMIALFIGIGNVLVDSGLASSLIRTSNPDQKDYSTVFFINLTGSLLIYVLVFLAAPAISGFFNQAILTSIIRVYALTFVITAFQSVQIARLSKEMNFKKQLTIQVPSLIAGGLLGIVLAYLGYGVWSLVWMNVCQNFLSSVMLWFGTGWRPDFFFDKRKFKHHFYFGYKLTLSALIGTIYQNLYNLIIGKFFSAAQLGFYTRANSMRQLPIQNIGSALNKVTYPMFAAIHNDDLKLRLAYRKLMQQVMFWIAPALIGLAVIAEPLFRFLLTDKWLPAVPYFKILCMASLLYPVHAYNLNILLVKGRSDLSLKIDIAKQIFIAAGIFCSIPFGIYGLLYFQVISTVISFFINGLYTGRMIGYSSWQQLKDILPILFFAFLVGLLTWFLDHLLVQYFYLGDLWRIIAAGVFYFSAYWGISYFAKSPALNDFRQIILKR